MESKRITVVQLEGLVLLKILKHCRDNIPSQVTGQLLGIDIEDRLEVSSCFPSFVSADASSKETEKAEAREEQMKQCLRAVNVEHHIVGWYRSAYLGNFISKDVVANQYEYQKDIPNSVFIVFDPTRTTAGRLALKAYRLTDEFMQFFKKGKFGHTSFRQAGIDSESIFQEVTIKIHNSHLVHAFLYELRELRTMNCDFDRLQLSSAPELRQNFELLAEAVDARGEKLKDFSYYQRNVHRQGQQQTSFLQKRQQENAARQAAGKPLLDDDLSRHRLFEKIKEPDRLPTLLIDHQMDQYCDQVQKSATMGFNTIFVAQGVHNADVQTATVGAQENASE